MTSPLNLFYLFFTSSLFTLGGGPALTVVLQDLFVNQNHLLTNQQFLTAMAIGRLTPGPAMIYTVVIGFVLLGIIGSVIALVATTIPSLLIFPVRTLYQKAESSFIVQNFFRGVSIAIVGLIFGTAIRLSNGVISGISDFLIALLSFIFMIKYKISVAKIVGTAFIFGSIYALWIK